MTIQEQVNKLIKSKSTPISFKNTAKLLKSEFQREATKEISDKQAIKIIKRMIKSNEQMIEYARTETDKFVLIVANSELSLFLPESNVSDDEIENWIKENIDFSQYKNKMQAIKPIMQHFEDSVDGSKIKEILEKL